MMMILGVFVFSLRTAAYQKLERHTQWRHPSHDRAGRLPAYQFTGRGEDKITLEGSIIPEFGMPSSLFVLRTMANTGRTFALIGGTGKVYGMYVITDIKETQQYFFKDGTPKQIDFTLDLAQVYDALTTVRGAVDRLSSYVKELNHV